MAWFLLSILAAVIVTSALNQKLNAGILAIAVSVLVAAFALDMSSNELMTLFPSTLFMLLFGISFFFSLMEENGTLRHITLAIFRKLHKAPRLVPLIFFTLVSLITASGISNIATVALMAPVAMSVAKQVNLPFFPMTILLCGAANAAAFSPLSFSGLIVRHFTENPADAFLVEGVSNFQWVLFVKVFLVQTVVVVLGFLATGGLTWLAHEHSFDSPNNSEKHLFKWTHLVSIAVFLLYVTILVISSEGFEHLLPSDTFSKLSENSAAVAIVGATLLLVLGAADGSKAMKLIPWDIIILVCGMSMLISLVMNHGAGTLVAGLFSEAHSPLLAKFSVASSAGLLSAFSSSSGVVLPSFLPLVSTFAKTTQFASPESLIYALSVGSHLVDASPLSTLGALCIAAIPELKGRGKVYAQLLTWGLFMVPVAGLICSLFF